MKVERLRRAEQAAPHDPVIFSRLAGIVPDPWQAKLLRSTRPRILLNCSRQSGKSTTTATLVMHTALYTPDSLVLLLSPGERQSGELFKKCLAAYHAVGSPVPALHETELTLSLRNGSRIVSLPGKEATVRSYSGVRLLVVDEASRVLDGLYYAVRPMLAVSGGRLLLLSTPFGKRGFFHKEWTEGLGWERFEVPATKCPRISPEFLAEERRTVPLWWYQQEYECIFGDAEGAVFSHEQIRAALDDGLEPLWAS